MIAAYGDERSNLKISRIILPFLRGHFKNTVKRIFYNYFLRDFHIASLELVLGLLLVFAAAVFGAVKWTQSLIEGVPATSGTVMLAGLPIIVGVQMLLSAINYDIQNVPRNPIHILLQKRV